MLQKSGKGHCEATWQASLDKDGKNGTTDLNHSMQILMDWMMQEGNYIKYCGHANNGTSKLQYCQIISDRMKDAGCRINRSAEAVKKKIEELESQFANANDWANQTGQGVKESDGSERFEQLVRSRCRWYFELLPIFGDRAKARPKVTTETLDQVMETLSESDEEEKEDGVSNFSYSEEEQQPSDDKSVAESVVPSAAASVSSKKRPSSAASSAKKKGRKAASKSAEEDEFLLSYLSRKDRYQDEKMRHNQKMEELEEKKLELTREQKDKEIEQKHKEIQWRSKQEELQYKRELLKTKHELETQGYSEEKMVAMFPELEPFCAGK
jgi:hypothetical protein